MRFLKYVKNSVWEFLLCLIMTVCLALNVLQGFYLPDNIQTNVAAFIAFGFVCTLLFYLFGYNKKTIILGIAAVIILAIAGIFALQGSNILQLEGAELEQAIPYFYIVTFFCSMFVYLLSRRKAGAIILAALGLVIICAVVFMQFEHFLPAYILYIAAAICMCFYRNYRINVVECSTV